MAHADDDQTPAFLWRLQRLVVDPHGKHNPRFDPAFPLQIRFYRFTDQHRLTPSYHDYLEVAYCLRGQGMFHVGGKSHLFREGQVTVIASHQFHLLEPVGGGFIEVITVYFMPELLYHPGDTPSRLAYLRIFDVDEANGVPLVQAVSPQSCSVHHVLRCLQAELACRDAHWQLAARNHLERLLLTVMRAAGSRFAGADIRTRGTEEVRRLSRVFVFLREHYDEPVKLERVAKVACVSPSYFCRLFKRATNSTLMDYVLRLRIDRAKELILRGSMPLTRISREVGFEGHSYFNRVFKRYTGLTPSEFAAINAVPAASRGSGSRSQATS